MTSLASIDHEGIYAPDYNLRTANHTLSLRMTSMSVSNTSRLEVNSD